MKQNKLQEIPVDSKRYDQDYFEIYNPSYDEFVKNKGVLPRFQEKINKLDFEGKNVLDVACGRGEIVRYAITKGAAKAVGIDYSINAINICTDMVKDLDSALLEKIEFKLMDAKRLEFKDNSFDYIFMLAIVEHLYDWELKEALAEARRVLKPGGIIYIYTGPNKYLFDIVRIFTNILGIKLQSCEYHVNELNPLTLHSYTKSGFEGRIQLDKDKKYWSKQMVHRGKLLNIIAPIVDFMVDNPLSELILTSWPIKIVYSTDMWFIGRKKENLSKSQEDKLTELLSKVGDLNFKRRIITMLSYLDIQPKDNILDMGCGEGFYSLIFNELYDCHVTAIDNDPQILEMAERWIRNRKNLTLELGNIYDLKYPDNYFDKIVCTEVIEHIIDDHQAVNELYRVLKPGGRLAVTVPNKNYPFVWDPLNWVRERLHLGHFNSKSGILGGIWAYDHKRLYSPEDLKALLTSSGFKVERLDVLTHYGVPFNHLVLYLGKKFYTTLPVPEDVRRSMEKFEWDANSSTHKESPVSIVLKSGLAFLKWVDSKNDRKFPLRTSTMAVAALVTKKK